MLNLTGGGDGCLADVIVHSCLMFQLLVLIVCAPRTRICSARLADPVHTRNACRCFLRCMSQQLALRAK
jgi:hypothetical protein